MSGAGGSCSRGVSGDGFAAVVGTGGGGARRGMDVDEDSKTGILFGTNYKLDETRRMEEVGKWVRRPVVARGGLALSIACRKVLWLSSVVARRATC